MKTHYNSLAEAIDDIKKEGFNDVFLPHGYYFHCTTNDKAYETDVMTLKHEFVFEKETDPGSEERLLILETNNGRKGYMIIGNLASLGTQKQELVNSLYRNA